MQTTYHCTHSIHKSYQKTTSYCISNCSRQKPPLVRNQNVQTVETSTAKKVLVICGPGRTGEPQYALHQAAPRCKKLDSWPATNKFMKIDKCMYITKRYLIYIHYKDFAIRQQFFTVVCPQNFPLTIQYSSDSISDNAFFNHCQNKLAHNRYEYLLEC